MFRGWVAVPYVPGLKSRAYRWLPNWLPSCCAAIASTVAWIWATGMLGSKIRTLGPRSGWAEECVARAGAAVAVPVAATVATAVTRASRRTRYARRLGVRTRTGDRDIVVTHLYHRKRSVCAPNHCMTRRTRWRQGSPARVSRPREPRGRQERRGR